MGLFSAIFAKRPGGSPFGNLIRNVAGSIPGVGGIIKSVIPPPPPQETAGDQILKDLKASGKLDNIGGGGGGGYSPGLSRGLDAPADGGGNKFMDFLKTKWMYVAGGLVVLLGGWFMLKPKTGSRRR